MVRPRCFDYWREGAVAFFFAPRVGEIITDSLPMKIPPANLPVIGFALGLGFIFFFGSRGLCFAGEGVLFFALAALFSDFSDLASGDLDLALYFEDTC